MTALAARVELDKESPAFASGAAIHGAIQDYAAAVVLADEVDPIITELVRLRCSGVHDCRLCGSLRLDVALEKGFDERMAAQIATYETSGLGDAAIAALRLTDAIILDPSSADEELAAELKRHFTDSQIAEICLDVVKWSEQKQLVSLRIEPPAGDELKVLIFDAEGAPIIGDTV
jgi:alkylhydroperoxidase family enzyme